MSTTNNHQFSDHTPGQEASDESIGDEPHALSNIKEASIEEDRDRQLGRISNPKNRNFLEDQAHTLAITQQMELNKPLLEKSMIYWIRRFFILGVHRTEQELKTFEKENEAEPEI